MRLQLPEVAKNGLRGLAQELVLAALACLTAAEYVHDHHACMMQFCQSLVAPSVGHAPKETVKYVVAYGPLVACMRNMFESKLL
jgi:hypothetical protein